MTIPEGAVKVHMYNVQDVLKPRGSMEKESIGLSILERLRNSYESWTDDTYGDNPDKNELIDSLRQNLVYEMVEAWNKFESEVRNK